MRVSLRSPYDGTRGISASQIREFHRVRHTRCLQGAPLKIHDRFAVLRKSFFSDRSLWFQKGFPRPAVTPTGRGQFANSFHSLYRWASQRYAALGKGDRAVGCTASRRLLKCLLRTLRSVACYRGFSVSPSSGFRHRVFTRNQTESQISNGRHSSLPASSKTSNGPRSDSRIRKPLSWWEFMVPIPCPINCVK